MSLQHPSNHLLIKGNHQIKSLIFKPNEQEAQRFKENLNNTSTKIQTLIKETLKTTEIIIKKTL